MLPLDSVFMLLFIFLAPFGLYFFLKYRVIGKMGCFFLERDKSINFKLHKVNGPHVEVNDETYGINPGRIRFIKIPIGWPALFQQIVPCSMYQREDYQPIDINEPLDWVRLLSSKDSAIEISSVLEPRWLAAIVRGTREGAPDQTKFQKWIPILTLGISVAVMVFLFYVMMQVSGISSEVSHLEDLYNLSK